MTQRPAKSPNQFCTNCGAALVAGARFCVECGGAFGGGTGAVRPHRLAFGRYAALLVPAVVVVAVAAAIWIGNLTAKEPPRIPARRAPAQQGELPPGHPPVTLPDDVRAAIQRKAGEMAAQPADVEGWKQLGLMQYEAGRVEPRYLADAAKTYEHVIGQQPRDLDALRALGAIAYLREDPQRAMGYYDRLLKVQPNDAFANFMIGNIHLRARRSAEAIRSYEAALAADPTLMDAQVNLGFAYRTAGDTARAVEEIKKARSLTTDDGTRQQIDQMAAHIAEPQAAAPATAAGAGSFTADVESVFRSHPIVGPKLDRFDWTDERTVKVVVHDFPMDTIPEEVRGKFTNRIKIGVREGKSRHAVTDPVTVEFVDAASGSVMETVTE